MTLGFKFANRTDFLNSEHGFIHSFMRIAFLIIGYVIKFA